MSNHNREGVLWLTLVDFLLQLILMGVFGAIAYFVASASESEVIRVPVPKEWGTTVSADRRDQYRAVLARLLIDTGSPASVESVLDAVNAGLISPEDMKAVIDFLRKLKEAGGPSNLKELIELLKGGPGGKRPIIDVAKALKGWGPPPCLLPDATDSPRNYRALARVRVSDNRIDFLGPTGELESVLKRIGRTYAEVASLTPADFRRAFGTLRTMYPECVYYLDIEAAYTLAEPREAIETAFYFGVRTRAQ